MPTMLGLKLHDLQAGELNILCCNNYKTHDLHAACLAHQGCRSGGGIWFNV